MTTHRFRLFADYFQFYLMDEKSEDDTSVIWTEESLERMLACAESTLGVGTLRNVDVDVVVEVLDEKPNFDSDEWNHIATGHISIPTGRLAVFGCTDYLPDASRIVVSPGDYEALYRSRGLDSIKNEWEDADDLYVVSIWPGIKRESELVKHWKSNGCS